MENFAWVFISALLVNNFVLTYFLGLCPFLGVSGSLETSSRLGLATTFVLVASNLVVSAIRGIVPRSMRIGWRRRIGSPGRRSPAALRSPSPRAGSQPSGAFSPSGRVTSKRPFAPS